MVPSLQSDVRRCSVAPAAVAALQRLPRLLPHEWLCGLLLVCVWARLVWTIGFFARDTILFLFFIAVNVAVVAFCAYRGTDFHWRLRLLFYPVVMNLVYFILKTAVPSIHPTLEDETLQAVDRWLIGMDLSLRLEPWVHPAFTEFFSFCYLWYLFYLFSSQIEYLLGDLKILKTYYGGLFSIYGVGYMGYSTLPALGPYLAMAGEFQVALEGWWFTQITSEIVLAASNRVDIFPSLHVANSLYILLFDLRHKPWRFWLYLVPCAGLFISTIYLRYHYFIDILCGLVLSVLALWLSALPERRKHEQ